MKTLTLDDDTMLWLAGIVGHCLIGNDDRVNQVFEQMRKILPPMESFPAPVQDYNKARPGALYLHRTRTVQVALPADQVLRLTRLVQSEFSGATVMVEK
jgi:hypothetical protein